MYMYIYILYFSLFFGLWTASVSEKSAVREYIYIKYVNIYIYNIQLDKNM